MYIKSITSFIWRISQKTISNHSFTSGLIIIDNSKTFIGMYRAQHIFTVKKNTEKKTDLECDEQILKETCTKSRVSVHVWTPRSGEDMLGHVSISTPNQYITLWPTGKGKARSLGIWGSTDHQFQDADYDEEKKSRPPEHTICLYSLNIAKLEQEFERVKKSIKGWTLIGGNRLVNNGSAESCSSLAYRLLKAGGIYTLVASSHSSRYSSVVTPKNLLKIVMAAKKAELNSERYSEMAKYPFEEETPLNK